ncbi:MAG: FAD:protein FMN transferase [Bacteroidales bacterium]|jgi:thiamine biosynthesis lipoprotein|nr:FAD:protein FMN transferase [Bacteroidales bacterium]
MKKSVLWMLAWLIFVIACNNNGKKNLITYKGNVQGSFFLIKFYAGADSNSLKTGIDSLFKVVDQTASVFDSNSVISLVNANRETELSDHFIKLFNKSQEVSYATQGNFDITVGPLVKAWGFWKSKGVDLSKENIDSLLTYVGYNKIRIVNTSAGRHILKEHPEIMLDFNAIAQGYTADVVAEYFNNQGMKDYLIEIGGEVRASGKKESGESWIVGIEKPAENSDSEQEIQEKVELNNMSLSTSGNYRKYFIKDGIKYSHTIDPHTGLPVSHSLLSVTVMSDNCAEADAYATAFMVMGVEKAKDFLKNHPGMEAYFIYSEDSGILNTYKTENFITLSSQE